MDMRSIWFKDKDGRPDPVLSFTFFAVFTILFKLLFAGAHIVVGKWLDFTVMGPDASVIGAAWMPTLGAYVMNKYVNYNYHPDYIKMKKDVDGDGDEEEVMVPRNQVKEQGK